MAGVSIACMAGVSTACMVGVSIACMAGVSTACPIIEPAVSGDGGDGGLHERADSDGDDELRHHPSATSQ
jgi:hypothetical protein